MRLIGLISAQRKLDKQYARYGTSLLSWCVLALILVACSSTPNQRLGEQIRQVPEGDTSAGHAAILHYGCGTCHVIPGVPGANAYVGPPLNVFDQRQYIAGTLINDADNLMAWLQDPQSIRPGSAMPNLGLTAEEARDIAAYLYASTR